MFRKKSKYKHVSINKKKYYFYKISWLDTGVYSTLYDWGNSGQPGTNLTTLFDKIKANGSEQAQRRIRSLNNHQHTEKYSKCNAYKVDDMIEMVQYVQKRIRFNMFKTFQVFDMFHCFS